MEELLFATHAVKLLFFAASNFCGFGYDGNFVGTYFCVFHKYL